MGNVINLSSRRIKNYHDICRENETKFSHSIADLLNNLQEANEVEIIGILITMAARASVMWDVPVDSSNLKQFWEEVVEEESHRQ